MIASVSASGINGTITAPASKSAMQRACALALLHKGTTMITNPGNSKDDLAAINIIGSLGAGTSYEAGKLIITSSGEPLGSGIIPCGESGLSFRMFAFIAALGKNEYLLTGEGSLLKRPMHFFDKIFPLLNVHLESNQGLLPLKIKGPLQPRDIKVDGSSSSQYITGLLIAFAKAVKNKVVVSVDNLASRPYVELTLQMLRHFGYNVKQENADHFDIKPAEPVTHDIIYHTEGDWSAASFLLVAGAIAGEIRVKGLDIYSLQADLAIMEAMQLAGANIRVDGSCVLVDNSARLRGFEFDATHCPDLFPPLVALAAYCQGETLIKGVSRLSGKESHRGETLMDVFGKLGIGIWLEGDHMIIKGGGGIQAATVSSHHDHRIAMACAVAALGASGPVMIEQAESVNKSYPGFYHDLKTTGAAITLTLQ